MKLLFACLLLSSGVSAQVTSMDVAPDVSVGRIKVLGTLKEELSYSVHNGDTLYILSYNNLEYKVLHQISTISFGGKDGAAETLYNAMKAAIKSDKGSEKDLQVGTNMMILKTENLAGKYLMVYTGDGNGYFQVTEREIDKLFGKR